MSDELTETDQLIPKTTNVDLGSLPYALMEETLNFVKKHGFSVLTMDLLLKASQAAEKIDEGIGAINDLRAAQEAYITHVEGTKPEQNISPTEDLQV